MIHTAIILTPKIKENVLSLSIIYPAIIVFIDWMTQVSRIKRQYLLIAKDLKLILAQTRTNALTSANEKVTRDVLANRKKPRMRVMILPVSANGVSTLIFSCRYAI